MRTELERSPRISIFEEIEARRRKQVAKGYDAAHDDEHALGEIALAAAAYAVVGNPINSGRSAFSNEDIALMLWPWALEQFTPWRVPQRTIAAERQNLVDAAAMLVAEIERLDRGDY